MTTTTDFRMKGLLPNTDLPDEEPLSELDGDEGQDRDSYSDDQDRDNYIEDDDLEFDDSDEDADYDGDDDNFQDEDDSEEEGRSSKAREPKVVSTETQEARFAKAWKGVNLEWKLPIDVAINLEWQSSIPGCGTQNVRVPVRVVKHDNTLLVYCSGLISRMPEDCGSNFYIIDEISNFNGPVFEQWYDDEAIRAGTRPRGDKTGVLVRWGSRVMVVVGNVKVKYTLPSIDGAATMEEAINHGKGGYGMWISEAINKGSKLSYRVVGGFPVMTLSHPDGLADHEMFIKTPSRKCDPIERISLSAEWLEQLESSKATTATGQMCLF